ncbi:hypothetical protein T01_9919 [Trichinella spiralis]|uniref:Uncharacterized protein n=1 Tax=Trichinella spiralis TaxID=6334 RepID=A0A0V1BM47_TRISP|nr:hypothetical protein T01_9919 [Trichinella spiralis]
MAYKKTFKVMYELYERVDILYPVMMNNLLPKIVFVFMLAMAANLCFSNPLSSKLDTNEIVSSSEENFTRMANISHLDLHASNLTVSANNTSLPNNGSEKNDDRNPVKKPNYAVYIDGIIRKTFFEKAFERLGSLEKKLRSKTEQNLEDKNRMWRKISSKTIRASDFVER